MTTRNMEIRTAGLEVLETDVVEAVEEVVSLMFICANSEDFTL